MRFDTIIIGGGLAGLTAGLRILASGRTCALISAGQGALHFSSGSFDFCNALPDGSPVDEPSNALSPLIDMVPQHPYALLGKDSVMRLAVEAEDLLRSYDIAMQGSLRAGNHLRLTPTGAFVPAWLSTEDACTAPLQAPGERIWPWRRVALLSIQGFLDSRPEMLVSSLRRDGVDVVCHELRLRELAERRQNVSEFRSIGIARILEQPKIFAELLEQVRNAATDVDCVLFPACIGLRGTELSRRIAEHIGVPFKLVPTLPPSLLGARINNALASAFVRQGGVSMPSDRVIGWEAAQGNPARVARVFTVNHDDEPLEAQHYLLAAGSFFNKGLRADQNSISEPVFGLDITDVPESRDAWTSPDFFASQPFGRFGLITDASMRAYKDGAPMDNLHVAGMILGNCDAVRIGCGAGVALVSALTAADAIAQK